MKEVFKIKANIVDVVSHNIYFGELIAEDGVISAINVISGTANPGEKYVLPGLVNSHVHVESSMLSPTEFSKIAVRHGTVAAVCDPHEIANVLGIYGVDYMIENGKNVPFKFFFGAPSCVPATDFETSGFHLNSEVVKSLLKTNDIYFLAEVMNYPGVINGDPEVLEKVKAGKHYNKPVDGHAPGLTGEDLFKYSRAGISTDHECVDSEEAIEKIKTGIKIQIREGSAAKNFEALSDLIDEYPEYVMICTDDSHPDDLINGHLNLIIKRGLEKGINFFNLIKAATYNPIKHYRLPVGLLQLYDPADFIVVDDLKKFNILETYIDGQRIWDGNTVLYPKSKPVFINNFGRDELSLDQIQVKKTGETFPVIETINGELITNRIDLPLSGKNGFLESDLKNDILKIVVASRYDNSPPAVGFVKNFGMKKGAIAESIAHDSHNLVAVGTNDEDLLNALNNIIRGKGGIVACAGKDVTYLPLEIAGLMTNSDAYDVAKKYEQINSKAIEFGSTLTAPFMTLSFLPLLVIPEIKISDKGLFDAKNFKFITT